MAIKAHCVVCGYDSEIGELQFSDYHPELDCEPSPLGWSNSLGVTAPEGAGQFCPFHLEQAHKLREFPAAEAVDRLRAISPRCVVSGCERSAVPGIYIADELASLRGICPGHARRLRGPEGQAALDRLRTGADLAEFEKQVAALDDTDPGIDISQLTDASTEAPRAGRRLRSAIRRFVRGDDGMSPKSSKG